MNPGEAHIDSALFAPVAPNLLMWKQNMRFNGYQIIQALFKDIKKDET